MPSVGSSVTIVTAAASTCLLGVSAGHETGFMGLGMPEREDRNPPDDGDDGRESDRGDCEESGLAVAEVYSRTGRSEGRAARRLTRVDTRLLDDVATLLPSTTTERRTITNSCNP